ncbi:hypothetical protein GC197_01430 [bacterium]|nr:hypothetical protein [bacterium]
MTRRKFFIPIVVALIALGASKTTSFGWSSEIECPCADTLASVQLNPLLHLEAEYRVAEAIEHPPIDWSNSEDHTFAEVSQPVAEKESAVKMISQWESLLASPIYSDPGATIQAHLRSIIKAEFAAQANANKQLTVAELPAASEAKRAEISLDDLPQVNTGEEVMTLIALEETRFDLDPYGYAEYNHYFEPEIYDWFVFVTDDLSVVYVYENSDVMPRSLDPIMLAEEEETRVAPESVEIAVQQGVRAIAAGDIDVVAIFSQLQQGWKSITQPAAVANLRRSELLPAHRVSQLRDLLRL